VVVVAGIAAVLPTEVFGQSKGGAPIHTTLCELVKTPEPFNGKIVQVRVIVRLGFEESVIRDRSCSAEIWVEGLDVDYFGIRITPGPLGPPVAIIRSEDFAKLERALRPNRFDTTHSVQATAVGRFDHVARAVGTTSDLSSWPGFGYISHYDSRLVLESVSDVGRKPSIKQSKR
jgi:hypothetical protein